MIKYITLVMILLSVSMTGCSLFNKTCVEPPSIYCPAPYRPVLRYHDTSFTHEDNMKNFIYNSNDLVDYTLKLETTVKCYIDSTKGNIK